MSTNNNNIRSIYIKNSRPYNKKSKNFYQNNNLKYEDNITEKNNIIFVKSNIKENTYSKENNRINQKKMPKKDLQNKNDDIDFNKNEKKKILNEKMNIFLENIAKDNNPMTIHNINLINSMNNITFYDSIPNIKKDVLKYPLNKFNSQTYNTNKNYNSKNNSPLDFKVNNKIQNNNILVNKNKLFMENKSSININYNSNNYKFNNNSLSKKKLPFKELNFKKLNLSENNKSITKFNKGNNFSNLNIKGNKNTKNINQYIDYGSKRESYQGDLSQSKNINNSTNKRLSKESLINRNDSPNYNTYSNCMNSIDEEEINKKKKRMILDKVNNRHIINVNKLESFKINDIIKNNNEINNNYKISDNNSNNISISKNSSNISSLLSNKNIDNYNKSKLDKENLNKIKKNINNENYYQTNNDNIKEEENNNKVKKTKSLGKIYKNNKGNKYPENNLSKKNKILSPILNSKNNIDNNITHYNSKKNCLGNITINDTYNYANNKSTYNNNKIFYSTFNSKNSPKSLFQILKRKNINNISNYNIEIPQINKMNKNININKNEKDFHNNSNIFEKIEVNKAKLSKNHNKSLNMKQIINIKETRNESLNIYSKKSFQESLMNNSEKNNSFSKKAENYYCLSNYKEKKEKIMKYSYSRKNSSPKKTYSNIIYNKKQFLNHIKKEKQSLKEKIFSPDLKQRKVGKIFDIKCINEDLNDISKIKNENLDDESINYNYIFNENEVIDNISEKNINKNITNKNCLIKSPVSTIYKKPGITFINNNSNSSLILAKDSNNKLPFSLYSNEIIEGQNKNYINNSKKKNKKIYLNIKLNKFYEQKEFPNVNDNNKKFSKNKININLNNINYEEGELLPKLKENILVQSFNSYKPIKNREINCSNEYIVNNGQFYVNKINTKVRGSNSFISKYFNYYINYNNNKIEKNKNYYISKVRINKKDLISYEIPLKKICFFSKKRKIFARIIPKVDICYFKKDLINLNNNIKKINNNNHFIDYDNLIVNSEFDINKKDNEDSNSIKFNSHQYSFASTNSIENGNNNYFEISFGKRVNKSINNNEIKKNSLNNNEIILNRFISSEKYNEQENKINFITDSENKSINNYIDKTPSIIYIKNKINYKSNGDNNFNLKKTEKGLKLLEKIAGNRFSPISNKNNNFFPNSNNIKENNNTNKKIIENKINDSYKNNIKNEFIEQLNIITINNYDLILNNISNLILNNNILTIDNVSQLLFNSNEFIEIIINKAMKEKKYIKIYAKLCKDIFISLMSIIGNYNDDNDIFDTILKDKSLKVILKNKIYEKINQLNFGNKIELKKNDINNSEKDFIYYELRLKFTNLIFFFRELLEIKLISSKSGFEILDILYKKYNNDNNKILYLEGIEILLNKMKVIIYEKNNLEYMQRYNKFIKNNLNNIFINIKKRDDLPKYLFYKLLNLIECHKKESKNMTIINNKYNIPTINKKYMNNNSLTILVENSNFKNISNNMVDVIKKDIEKFLLEPNVDQIKYKFFDELIKRYNEELNIKKKIEIWELFYYYIEACIDLVNNEEKIYIVNEYIENIINNFTIDIPNETWEMLHYKLISLFLNINEICTDNIYMHQIMGYLLFLLINNKLFFIKDLNNFLNKDNEIIINISKAVKYTIICADKDAKKYHNDFKQTKLFIGNDIFYNIVTKPLNKKFFLNS